MSCEETLESLGEGKPKGAALKTSRVDSGSHGKDALVVGALRLLIPKA